MRIIVFILSFFVFVKTISYGIFEFKENNKIGAIIIYSLSLVALIAPNVLVYIR